MIRKTIPKIVYSTKNLFAIIIMVVFITGCKKDDINNIQTPSSDGNSIKFVMGDNFNFSMAYAALNYTRLTDTLAGKGPYTVMVPNNDAFALVSITELRNLTFFYSQDQLTNLMRYNILTEKLQLKKLPVGDNQLFKTLTGGNLYVSKYLNGTDTVTTINGVSIVNADNPASNGLVQVMPQLMNPEIYAKAANYIRADTLLTLFNAAMERSGLSAALLTGNDTYTLLAPSNSAFQQSAGLGLNLGISTLDSITHADPVKLAALLRYHILKGRYFDNDIFRLSNLGSNPITMLNGGKIAIGGVQGSFKSITFTATGSNGIPAQIDSPISSSPTTVNVNIPCGNGVVHIINRVLTP